MAADAKWFPTPFGEVGRPQEDLSKLSYDDSQDSLFESDDADFELPEETAADELLTVWDMGASKQELEEYLLRHIWIRKKGTFTPTPFGALLRKRKAQRRYLKFLINLMSTPGPKRVAVLKGRQVGISTATLAFFLYLLQRLEWNALLVTHSEDSAVWLMQSLKEMYDRLPPDKKQPLQYNLKNALIWGESKRARRTGGTLGHMASFRCRTAKGAYVGSGGSTSLIQLSEAAKYDTVGDLVEQMQFILSILQSCPKNAASLVVAEFTANGAQGWAHETWQHAVSKTTGHDDLRWIPYFVSWVEDESCRRPVPKNYKWSDWDHEDFDKEKLILSHSLNCGNTLDEALQNLFFRRVLIESEMGRDYDLFDQEYPVTPGLAWLLSGRQVFSRKLLLPQEVFIREPLYRMSVEAIDDEAPTTSTEWGTDAPAKD